MRNHTFESHTLDVKAFYDSVGKIPPDHDTTRPDGWIPKSVTVTGLNAHLLRFISTSSSGKTLVEERMVDVAAAVDWDTYSETSGSVELTCQISHSTKDAHYLAKTWTQDAQDSFSRVLTDEFASEEVVVQQQAWGLFTERIAYVNDLDCDKIAVDVDNSACVVRVTGLRQDVEAMCDRLQRDQSQAQDEVTRAANVVTVVLPNVELHELRMLNAQAFKSEQETKYPTMKVGIDTKSLQVEFTGRSSEVEAARLAMFDIINNITPKSVAMSRSLINIVNGQPMKKRLVDQFKAKRICAVFDNNMERDILTVYALNERDVSVAVETIKNETDEITVTADLAGTSARDKWEELVSKLESDHAGFLAIKEHDGCIWLSGAYESVKDAQHKIQDTVNVTVDTGDLEMIDDKDVRRHTAHSLLAGQPESKASRLAEEQPSLQGAEGGRSKGRGARDDVSDTSGDGGVVVSSVRLPGAATIEVVKGDLVTFQAGAIVNATTGQLSNKGGLAKAIVDAGTIFDVINI